MSNRDILEAVAVAFGTVSWPILGKYSHTTGPWMGFLVMSGTTITLALLALSQGQLGGGSFPTWRSLLFLGIGGLLNGRAMYRYSIKASGLTQTGNYVALIAVLMILEAPFFDMFLNRNWLTLRQWCGVGCGIACVYFLNQE